VKKAVADFGFIGVKLYPPMGFAASGNANLDFSAVGVADSVEFGMRLDAALDDLFAWALDEDVPIMAHCNFSEESKHGFDRRASPVFWESVLARHPGLRLNLGHFGGQDNLGAGGVNEAADWPETIIALMSTPEGARLYTDVGNFDMSGAESSWFTTLAATCATDPVLLSRLMYGSDWMMLALGKDYDKFLERFRAGLTHTAALTAAQIADIMGGNARRFLGLDAGEKPRARLVAFYQASNLTLPAWLQ
jgi:predicted TIM-barrel fold metal-dependent hydrolase